MYIYVVEFGIMMNGFEWEFDERYHASSFEKALGWIVHDMSLFFDKKAKYQQVNENYWRIEADCESIYGIKRIKLDEEYINGE